MKRLISMVLSVIMVISLLPLSILTVSASTFTSDLPTINLGDCHSAAIKTDGSLWTWGDNGDGQLGNYTRNSSYIPIKIMDNVAAVSLGYEHSAAIKNDGSLWTWGANSHGQSGTGSGTNYSSIPIKIIDNVAVVSLGGCHSAAIKTDGSLWTWGDNYFGQSGNNDKKRFNCIPIKIMDNVATVSLGGWHSAAIKIDGSLWTWGDNGNGQLGNDDKKRFNCKPIKIMDNVAVVSLGNYHSAAIKTDGSLWTWGANGDGQLGNGTTNSSHTPIKIMDNVAMVSLWDNHSAAIKTDGSLWTWGANKDGQLGNGTTENSTTPIKIIDNVATVSLGDGHSAAIKTDGSLWMWGYNYRGQLGNGTTADSPTPIKIMQLNAGLVIEGENFVQKDKETVLKATRYDENGNVAPEGGIAWSCSDESIAQISPWGNNVTVKGLKGGKATITATHAECGQKADFEIEVVSYVMTLAGGYTVMLDEELEINYAVKQDEEYVHNDLDIEWEIESKDSNNAVKIISDKDNTYTRALTIKGINEGEYELVAKVDGAELGRTKIEVLGNLAETIEQEVVLRAKILKDNSQYKYYKNNFTDLPEMFTKDMNKTPAVLYNAINDVFKAPTDRTNFYEIVLLDILTDGESTKLLGELGNIVDNKIVQHATKQIGNLDFDTNASSADSTVKKMFDELLDEADDVGKVKVGDVLDGLYTGKKMVDTYIDTVAATYSLGLVSNSQIKVLEDIKNNTTNSNLKEACDNVLDMYYKSSKDGVSYAAQLGMVESGYDGLEFATGQLIDTVCKLNWVSALYKGAFDVGTTVSNLAYNADDLSAQTLTLVAYAEIGDCLKEAVTKAESKFNSKADLASASKFMALADTYKVCLLKGCDSSYKLVETTKTTEKTSKTFKTAVFGVLGLTKDAITGLIDLFNDSKDYDHTMKTITNIKKNIGLADFYSTEGTDIVEYLREVKSTTTSEWAKSEIEKAKKYGFLPDYMQNNYQNNITRAEFCTILTWMIEEKTGKVIGQLIEEKGTPIKSPFEDTYYEYADYMCKLGIVNGVSATEFNPLGEITREQAATMLTRTADVLGYDTSYNTSVESGVSSWATEGVGFVTENGIMNGTGNGFEPQGKYTKEQAIVTFVRMYDNLAENNKNKTGEINSSSEIPENNNDNPQNEVLDYSKSRIIGDYIEGVARVELNNKYGYIDENGNVIVEPIYDETRFFTFGFAPVILDDKWGLIDRGGNVVVPLIYDSILWSSAKGWYNGKISEKWINIYEQWNLK